ncbi:MAG TPA: hypothetical protein VKE74_35105, partial [Gemmataceae bacterium]|nr:hypothetical protein [Gemmataceae bacterium]
MSQRILGSAVVVVLLPAVAFAQRPPVSVASGVGGFGGGFRAPPAMVAPVRPFVSPGFRGNVFPNTGRRTVLVPGYPFYGYRS